MTGELIPISDLVEKCRTWNPAKEGNGYFRYVDLSSVDKDRKSIIQVEEVSCQTAPSRARQLVKSGDILVSTVRPNLNGVAQVPHEYDGATASTGFCVLRPIPGKLNSDFLFHWVKTPAFVNSMMNVATGANYPAVSDRKVRASLIPCLPLSEQKRIAAILDAADALRAKRRETLAQLDNLLQSTFLEMFGDPAANPRKWETSSLGDVTSIEAPMVDPRQAEFQGLLHYGPDRIKKDSGELLPAQTAFEEQLKSGKFLCSPGEILYSKIRPYLNKVALVKEKCLCSADVYPVRPDESVITKEYLWLLLRSKAFLDYVASFSRRANIPKLNRKQFAGYEAPIPPMATQKHFKAIAQSVEQQKSRLRAHLDELDTLFAALQARAFAGEL